MTTPCPMCDGKCCRTEIHRIPTSHSGDNCHVCPGCRNGTAPAIDFKRMKAMFNEADTLLTEIGYALEGKEVPKGKDELLDRVIELRDARRLDNEDLARSFDMGWDASTAAVVAWLRGQAESTNFRPRKCPLADAIERGDHMKGNKR